jgi:hypothetical protein
MEREDVKVNHVYLINYRLRDTYFVGVIKVDEITNAFIYAVLIEDLTNKKSGYPKLKSLSNLKFGEKTEFLKDLTEKYPEYV